MGKTKIIPLVIRKKRSGEFVAPWPVKSSANVHGLGQPTTEKLGQWRDDFNESLLPGGANKHIGQAGWLQCNLEVYDQKNRVVVCEFVAPSFELLPPLKN